MTTVHRATGDGAPPPRVHVSGEARPGEPPELWAARVAAAVDRAALAHTRCLAVHAAAVSGPAGCAVLPAPAGEGKSTLTAAAMRHGLALLSDEAACLAAPVGQVLPHPRPLGLSRHSRGLVGLDDALAAEVWVAPEDLGVSADPSVASTCVLVATIERPPGSTGLASWTFPRPRSCPRCWRSASTPRPVRGRAGGPPVTPGATSATSSGGFASPGSSGATWTRRPSSSPRSSAATSRSWSPLNDVARGRSSPWPSTRGPRSSRRSLQCSR